MYILLTPTKWIRQCGLALVSLSASLNTLRLHLDKTAVFPLQRVTPVPIAALTLSAAWSHTPPEEQIEVILFLIPTTAGPWNPYTFFLKRACWFLNMQKDKGSPFGVFTFLLSSHQNLLHSLAHLEDGGPYISDLSTKPKALGKGIETRRILARLPW